MKRKKLFKRITIVFLIIFITGFAFAQANPNLTGYYVNVNGTASGPHDTAGLRQLVTRGQLTRTTLVWKEGMANWAAAGTVSELVPLLPSATPPPLPTSPTPPPIPNQNTQEPNQSGKYWFNSFAPGFENNNIFFNAGVGLGPTGGYYSGIPPISASLDFKFSDSIPITLGVSGIFSTWNWTTSTFNGFINITYTNIGIAGRVMYHLNFAKNLDTYMGVTLGYVIQSASVESSRSISDSYQGYSFFLWGTNIGFRYFFSNNLGFYGEFSYSGLQYFNAGITFKF